MSRVFKRCSSCCERVRRSRCNRKGVCEVCQAAGKRQQKGLRKSVRLARKEERKQKELEKRLKDGEFSEIGRGGFTVCPDQESYFFSQIHLQFLDSRDP